jgi:hypothetical protein
MGYIEVEKIIEKEVEKKDSNGLQVYVPNKIGHDGMPMKAMEKVVYTGKELIRLEHVRSAQPWVNKSDQVKNKFSGPLTMLFMVGDERGREDKKKPSILINESYESFAKRIGAIRLVINAVRSEKE